MLKNQAMFTAWERDAHKARSLGDWAYLSLTEGFIKWRRIHSCCVGGRRDFGIRCQEGRVRSGRGVGKTNLTMILLS